MKKLIAVLLTLVLALGAVSTLAESLTPGTYQNMHCNYCGIEHECRMTHYENMLCIWICEKTGNCMYMYHTNNDPTTCPYCQVQETADETADRKKPEPAVYQCTADMKQYSVHFLEKGWTPVANELLKVKGSANGKNFSIAPAVSVNARTEMVFTNGDETFVLPLAINANGTIVLLY